MSLIRCPECKKAISDTVSACPHCGYNISQSEKEAAIAVAAINPVLMESETKTDVVTKPAPAIPEDEGSTGGGFALGFLLGLIGLIIAACVGKKNTKSGAVTGFFIQAIIGIIFLIAG